MISIDQLRSATRVRGTSQDSYLRELEVRALAYLEAKTHKYYGSEVTRTDRLPGLGTNQLILLEPVNDITTTVITEIVQVGEVGTILTRTASDGFELWDTRTVMRRGGSLWTLGYLYQCVYPTGYESGMEPPLARDIVTKLVVYWNERRVPLPNVGEAHTFPVPNHLNAEIGTLARKLVA